MQLRSLEIPSRHSICRLFASPSQVDIIAMCLLRSCSIASTRIGPNHFGGQPDPVCGASWWLVIGRKQLVVQFVIAPCTAKTCQSSYTVRLPVLEVQGRFALPGQVVDLLTARNLLCARPALLRRTTLDTLGAFLNPSLITCANSGTRRIGTGQAAAPCARLGPPSCGRPNHGSRIDGYSLSKLVMSSGSVGAEGVRCREVS